MRGFSASLVKLRLKEGDREMEKWKIWKRGDNEVEKTMIDGGDAEVTMSAYGRL